MRVLVTGGAGFIGSYIVDELVTNGVDVVVIDSLEEQVHHGKQPDYLNPAAEYKWARLDDTQVLDEVLPTVDAVIHQAALVGVGQSMYEISRYSEFSIQHTATLLDKIAQNKNIQRLIMASSMSVYGEGKYVDPDGNVVRPTGREDYAATDGSFELYDHQGSPLKPAPITEEDTTNPYSVYGLTKHTQEKMCLIVGKAYDIPTVAFRYFGVYGQRQALSNPYAGLMAMFAGKLLNDRQPLVFEDGNQTRDFIHVTDVARANYLALTAPDVQSGAYNLTYGQPITVGYIAEKLCEYMSDGIEPNVTGQYRKGDIRHCFGDVSKIERALNFRAEVHIDDGLRDLAEWVASQHNVDLMDVMETELVEKGLLVDRAPTRRPVPGG